MSIEGATSTGEGLRGTKHHAGRVHIPSDTERGGFDGIVRMRWTTAALDGARKPCTASRFADSSALLSPRDGRYDVATLHDRLTHRAGERGRERS